ncbi:MAG: hypothetical protein K0R08_2057 [Solimicrobium sp.]|jgi:flagellar motor switch/type III secretory pathway protein FliN|nr:hypothetical protein [Solimicrobium sp.]
MKTFTSLRRVDPKAHNLVSTYTKLNVQGYQPRYSRPFPGTRYLRIYGQFEDQAEIHGLLDLVTWAKATLPALDGIDWSSMEDSVVHSLINEHPLELSLSNQHTPFKQIKVAELIADIEGEADLSCVDAFPGEIMVEGFAPHLVTDASEIASLSHIPIPLTFSLGYSALPLHALSTIEVGDVLLIEHIKGRVSSNGKTLFTSELNHETIMILERTENETLAPETSQATESLTGINALPIELSIVLMEKIVPLNQFKAITPGEIIELPEGAILDVEIRANQQCFARGELIQLTNGQLGVEIRSLWPKE